MLEKTVKAAVKKRLKEIGAYQFWPVQMGYGTRTIDCLFCYKGRFGAIECKRPGETPTLIQHLTIESIVAAGGLVFVIDSVEDAGRLFDGEVAGWLAIPQ
jgi:hypothetical protein